MPSINSLQETYINAIIKSNNLASVYLMSGIRLKGHLIAHDETCVFLKADQLQMIYKHKISTILTEMSFSRF